MEHYDLAPSGMDRMIPTLSRSGLGPIKSVNIQSNLVTFAHKAGTVFTDDFSEDGARYIVENVFEGLDAPGEWYLNRRTGELFYYPMAGEDMSRAEVIAPFALAHLRLEGNAAEQRYVEHLHFYNLSFTHTRFELPAGNSNDQQGSASVPAGCAFQSGFKFQASNSIRWLVLITLCKV